MDLDSKIKDRLGFIYTSEISAKIGEKVEGRIKKYDLEPTAKPRKRTPLTQKDVVLITYGDAILPKNGDANKLQTLATFLTTHLGNAINTIHILPFFPSSSDGGFSVIDYKSVRDDLGGWKEIEALSNNYKIMADLVINHVSRESAWFKNYQMDKKPGKDYFVEMDPAIDLSEVIRPRSSSLLSTVETTKGMRYVWTTFSDDQIDLDFSNPDVLLEFIDILLFYLSKGINMIRLDAIAYLWKKAGTSSIHLKETHEIVKLLRDIVDYINPDITLITETNVPFDENISYFGNGDEAHMIYQFSLPPLLLHAILTENAEYLSKWAASLPEVPRGCSYFNFTASHDGIGVRPLEGLVPDKELNFLTEGTKKRGGFVSYKNNRDGSQSPYELNITYFDAFSDLEEQDIDLQTKRYLCSQIIMLSLKGIPGIYFHNLTATKNYIDSITTTGTKRSINRKQWQNAELETLIKNASSTTHIILNKYRQLLTIRKEHPAFSPEAKQEVLDLDDTFFGIIRQYHIQETILCISNITQRNQTIPGQYLEKFAPDCTKLNNLLENKERSIKPQLELDALETVWLLV